ATLAIRPAATTTKTRYDVIKLVAIQQGLGSSQDPPNQPQKFKGTKLRTRRLYQRRILVTMALLPVVRGA
ncbi:hypothetical protein PIB30_107075, partial [Stylosanthes scabra]|nr:hypothetical protein [Stylosanthes scabra]